MINYRESIIQALKELEKIGIVSEIIESENEIAVNYHVEIPQYPVNDIKHLERIIFDCSHKQIIPIPYFSREDFPRLPHLIRNTGAIKVPCLIPAQFEQIALNWNAFYYVERVHHWLYESARGTLHQEDQLLEHIYLQGNKSLIIPLDFEFDTYYNGCILLESNLKNIYKLNSCSDELPANCLLRKYNIGSKKHLGIEIPPNNLKELFDFIFESNISNDFKNDFKTICYNNENYDKSFIIFLEYEVYDEVLQRKELQLFPFLFEEAISEIGLKINFLCKIDDFIAPVLYPEFEKEKLSSVGLSALGIHFHYDQIQGRTANGNLNFDHFPVISLIGIGATGGQIARNISQTGFAGNLILVDNDTFLPHNTSRWLISDDYGNSKVNIVSKQLNEIYHKKYAIPIFEKIKFGSISNELLYLLNKSHLLVDTSASIIVQRTMDKNVANSTQRVTFFLSPNGNFGILFYTPISIDATHTQMEMTIYNQIISNPEFKHILDANIKEYSYSGDTCRSLSFQISSHIIGIQSYWASYIIEKLYNSKECRIIINSINENLESKVISIQPEIFIQYYIENCNSKIYITKSLIESLNFNILSEENERSEGILIGAYDSINDTLYVLNKIVVMTNSLIPKSNNIIEARLKEIAEVTHRNIYYIGDWCLDPKVANLKLAELRQKSKLQNFPYILLNIKGTEIELSI